MLELGPLMSLYLITAVTEMALGIFVFLKGRGSPVNHVFLILTIFTSIGTVLDLLTFSLTDMNMATWVYRMFLFVIILEIGTAYRLNSMVSFDTGKLFPRTKSIVYPILILCLAVLLPLTVGELQQGPQGLTPASPLPLAGLMAILLTYVLLMTTSLRNKWSKSEGRKRRNVVIFSLALIFPAVLMLVIMLLSVAGLSIPRAYALGDVISMFILTYGILRYDLLVPPRVMEEAAPPTRRAPSLVKGRAYLFEFSDPNRMFESVIQEMEGGVSTLIICRTHPDQLRARYRLTKTPIIWLAQSPGQDRIDPSNLQMLSHIIMKFLLKGPSIIAIEGLEYLLMYNEMNKVLRFLSELEDNVIVEGSILLVTVDPRTLTERQKAILEREFELVLENKGAETAI
ncbi:MAG: DUF835 domain-containing protein [Methanomassiliicoccales archaeon]|nr:DUF835 domain-containing protein [Methanomassiliicoccales archaeon]